MTAVDKKIRTAPTKVLACLRNVGRGSLSHYRPLATLLAPLPRTYGRACMTPGWRKMFGDGRNRRRHGGLAGGESVARKARGVTVPGDADVALNTAL